MMDAQDVAEPLALRLGSSLRCRAPSDTWARATALMPSLGISRVTDITRLDHLGLPVFASIRPRSLNLRVNSGKGLVAPDARIGALMECVEHAVAEPQRTAWAGREMSLGQLRDGWRGTFDVLDLAPRKMKTPSLDRAVAAIRCEALSGAAAAWLPAERVFVPFSTDAQPMIFAWSTTGLASGNSMEEATLHALLEVLERDAVTMELARQSSRWIAPGQLPAPFPALARAWRERGVALAVRQVANEFSLPCFEAFLDDVDSPDAGIAYGSGLHLDRGVAASRAICEAAQARLGFIQGGRDDLTRFFDTPDSPDRRASRDACVATRFDTTRSVAFDDVPHVPCADRPIAALLDDLLHRLHEPGFPHVYRHRFDIDLNGLHVVRVIVPRCEDGGHAGERMGRRLFDEVTRGR